MDQRKSAKQLAKTVEYALGRCPEEFGLVLDADGYVNIKTFLKAVSEEDGWKHVRRSHIDELFILLNDSPVEIKENRIRAVRRDRIPPVGLAEDIPKILYACVRRKGYAFVLEKGIRPSDFDRVILSSDPEMAVRLGKRIDPEPILLTVYTQKARSSGVTFYRSGETFYLADSIPAQSISGPPLQKEKGRPGKKDEPGERMAGQSAGSFILEFSGKGESPKKKGKKGKDEIAWKKDLRRLRKEKEKMWPS